MAKIVLNQNFVNRLLLFKIRFYFTKYQLILNITMNEYFHQMSDKS